MTDQEKNFLSDLSLTFSALDTRRWMCFNLATGKSVDEAKAAVNEWVTEMSVAKIEVYHGLTKKSWEKE